LHLPRFRLRALMVAVAIVAVLLGLWAGIERRRADFRRIARYHSYRNLGLLVDSRSLTPLELRRDEWHAALAKKYTRAARYPWLPVEPDPPEPE
jgi:hypothetical protein